MHPETRILAAGVARNLRRVYVMRANQLRNLRSADFLDGRQVLNLPGQIGDTLVYYLNYLLKELVGHGTLAHVLARDHD